jgi:hypothetical protein
LILFNGVFAMAELAILTAKRLRLETAAEQGNVGAGTTATSVVNLVVPPTPLQESENFFVPLVSSRSVSVPDVGLAPVKGNPLAEQLVASVLRHESTTDSPGSVRVGCAVSVTSGFGNAKIVRVAALVPPGPAQVSTKVLVRSLRAGVVKLPRLAAFPS